VLNKRCNYRILAIIPGPTISSSMRAYLLAVIKDFMWAPSVNIERSPAVEVSYFEGIKLLCTVLFKSW
jgi:hypothetical protein